MSYREKDVVCKFTQGSMQSDCTKYLTHDLIDMFDETYVVDEEFTVNDCIEDSVVQHNLVVVEKGDDMFVYLNKNND